MKITVIWVGEDMRVIASDHAKYPVNSRFDMDLRLMPAKKVI